MVDIAHSLVADGADMRARQELADLFESAGHEWRTKMDAGYKRATWGLRDKPGTAMKLFAADGTKPSEQPVVPGGGSLREMRAKLRG